VTVIEGTEIPPQFRNNYDLLLKHPAEANPVAERRADIAKSPTVISRETVKKMYGMKLLADRTKGMEMATGAKVVGVEFMAKWNGEWCMGWHDGMYASFPFEVVRLEPPPHQEIRMGTPTGMKAVARWKFRTGDKDKGDWLKFDKDELITNINCE
jgi:hypothetical protein